MAETDGCWTSPTIGHVCSKVCLTDLCNTYPGEWAPNNTIPDPDATTTNAHESTHHLTSTAAVPSYSLGSLVGCLALSAVGRLV